jgi:hypothetical protein
LFFRYVKELVNIIFFFKVPDNPIPSRAKLTLPNFLEVQVLCDGSYSVITKSIITKGTKFGPFQAEKTQNLEPSISFPLKIFTQNEDSEYYLDTCNEERCNWMMYVGSPENLEEQNLICYQVGQFQIIFKLKVLCM